MLEIEVRKRLDRFETKLERAAEEHDELETETVLELPGLGELSEEELSQFHVSWLAAGLVIHALLSLGFLAPNADLLWQRLRQSH